jgi:hypothetical protein
MSKWRELDAKFKEFAALADYQEVCRVTVRPDGTYTIPSEKDGKIAQVSPEARHALAAFLREAAERLECPAIEDASAKPKPEPSRKRRAA